MIEVCRAAVMASLIALIAPVGAGWLWAGALTRRGPGELSFGVVYWLGVMTLGAVVFLGYGIGLPQQFVFFLGGLLSAGGWIAGLPRFRRGTMSSNGAAWWLLPLAVVGIGYCVLDPVHDWDAHLIWLARVRLLEEWIPISRFRALEIVQPGYPFLGSALWWWIERTARVPVEAGRVVFLFTYLAFFLAVLTREDVKRSVPIKWLWILAAYAGFSLQIVNGYQDGFLMVSAGIVALSFMEWGDRGSSWIIPLAACLSLIKAEGAVLGCILLLCWFGSAPSSIRYGRRPYRRGMLLGVLGFVSIIGCWMWVQSNSGLDVMAVQGDAFRIPSMRALAWQTDRFPRILWEIARQSALNWWISAPFLAAVVTVLIRRDRLDRERTFLLAFVILHLFFVTLVFWVTQQPFEWHVSSALHRLLLQGRLVMTLFVFQTATCQWAPLLEERFVWLKEFSGAPLRRGAA